MNRSDDFFTGLTVRASYACLATSLALVIYLALLVQTGLSATEEQAPAWADLFDGATLHGWQRTGDADWKVVDGTIQTTGDQTGFLMSTREYTSFELEIEFRAGPTTNSGVFLRSAMPPTDPTKDCYEVNIAPLDNPFPTGSIVGRMKVALSAQEFPTAGQWHKFGIQVDSNHWTVKLDGKTVLEYHDPTPVRSGHIGLQSNQGEVAFRNIRVRELEPR
jgi:Domain of Unknown Function (DUF1080)